MKKCLNLYMNLLNFCPNNKLSILNPAIGIESHT